MCIVIALIIMRDCCLNLVALIPALKLGIELGVRAQPSASYRNLSSFELQSLSVGYTFIQQVTPQVAVCVHV